MIHGFNFKAVDKHTPEYYYNQFKQALGASDSQIQSAGVYGLMFGFSEDLDILCPGGIDKFPPYHIRDAVDYLDRKYAATIKFLSDHGINTNLPPTGWKESFLETRKDVREVYGSDKQIIT